MNGTDRSAIGKVALLREVANHLGVVIPDADALYEDDGIAHGQSCGCCLNGHDPEALAELSAFLTRRRIRP